MGVLIFADKELNNILRGSNNSHSGYEKTNGTGIGNG
jgi:hypothetical protein